MKKLKLIFKSDKKRNKKKIILNGALSDCPKNVLKALASSFNNVDAENYVPSWLEELSYDSLLNFKKYTNLYKKYKDDRSNKCCEYFNIIEELTKRNLKKIYANNLVKQEDMFINVQSPTGAISNLIIVLSLCEYGDTIVSMDSKCGGHFSHGEDCHFVGKNYKIKTYGVDSNGNIDYKKITYYLKEYSPKLLIAGASSYPKNIDFKKLKQLISKYSPTTLLFADIAHTAGLIAGKVFNSPFGFADVIMMVGYKTFCGSRASAIFSFNQIIAEKINKTAFPYILGSPLANQIAGFCVSTYNALDNKFKITMKNVVNNAKLFENKLIEKGLIMFTNTESHIVVLDVKKSKLNLSAHELVNILEDNNIMASVCSLPNDKQEPSGIRFGFTWVSQKKYTNKRIVALANFISNLLNKYKKA